MTTLMTDVHGNWLDAASGGSDPNLEPDMPYLDASESVRTMLSKPNWRTKDCGIRGKTVTVNAESAVVEAKEDEAASVARDLERTLAAARTVTSPMPEQLWPAR